MTQMKYKGYIGSAEVSVEDKVVFGKILHITDLVTYEADDPASLQSAFEAAVDDYIEDCRESGREPDRPFKGSFNVRVRPELHRDLVQAAAEKDMSLNEYVARALSEHNDCVGLHGRQDVDHWSISALRVQSALRRVTLQAGKERGTPNVRLLHAVPIGEETSWSSFSRAVQ